MQAFSRCAVLENWNIRQPLAVIARARACIGTIIAGPIQTTSSSASSSTPLTARVNRVAAVSERHSAAAAAAKQQRNDGRNASVVSFNFQLLVIPVVCAARVCSRRVVRVCVHTSLALACGPCIFYKQQKKTRDHSAFWLYTYAPCPHSTF